MKTTRRTLKADNKRLSDMLAASGHESRTKRAAQLKASLENAERLSATIGAKNGEIKTLREDILKLQEKIESLAAQAEAVAV
jgi:ABC-type transporter Mla subunit MlaD